MTHEEIRQHVLEALGHVAPEANLGLVRPEFPLRDQLDLDSMDFLNFVIAIHTALGVDIPERDYPRFATINACVDYVAQAMGTAQP